MPVEVWDAEVDYFGLLSLCQTHDEQNNTMGFVAVKVFGEMTEEKREKRKNDTEEEFARRCKAKLEKLSKLKDQAIQARRKIYELFLNEATDGINPEAITGYDFIEPDERKKDDWSWQYPAALKKISLKNIYANKDEFIEFAKEFGFEIVDMTFHEHCTSKKHTFDPASEEHFSYKHHCLHVSVRPIY